MKKGVFFISVLFLIAFFSFHLATALSPCILNVSLVNQDPYPAIPGDSVKLLFQVNGIVNPDCGQVNFKLLPNYPISLSPNQQSEYTVQAGTFKQNYKSFFLAPYQVMVANNSLNGDNPIEVDYHYGNNQGYLSKQFNLNVQDVRGKFEVNVQNYDPNTKMITFNILNYAKLGVKAIDVEVPPQKGILIQGSNQNIIGDLDSNEYTTADFKVKQMPKDSNITLILHYSDITNNRRSVKKEVSFNSNNFSISETKGSSFSTYLVIIIILALVLYYFYRRNKKKKVARVKRR